MSKILEAIKALTQNATHPKFLTEALSEIKTDLDALKERAEGLGHEATGETGAAVAALGERLDSLTSAFNSLGLTFGSITQRIEELEQKANAPVVQPAPAAPAVPPVTA
jgi:phage shock protein A